jgi:hypothetical protein
MVMVSFSSGILSALVSDYSGTIVHLHGIVKAEITHRGSSSISTSYTYKFMQMALPQCERDIACLRAHYERATEGHSASPGPNGEADGLVGRITAN